MSMAGLIPNRIARCSLTPVAIIVAALCIAIAYFPGLTGPFVFDDHENITENPPIALHAMALEPILDALLANDSGPFGRPLASLSFALNHYFAGGFDSAWSFKATNLAIHIFNAGLVYLLVLALCVTPRLRDFFTQNQRRYLAGTVALLWAFHPIQVTSVLYVVQRMTSLSAAFVLAGALIFLQGRMRLARGESGSVRLMMAGLIAGMLIGATAKENAVLLPLYALVVEWTLFERQALTSSAKRALTWCLGMGLAVPVALFLAYVTLQPDFIAAGYAVREFSPLQRLATEARVLWLYVWLLLAPVPSHYSLFHDAIEVSRTFFNPLSTAFSVVAWSALTVYALYRPQRQSALKFGILWFLAGHALEAGVFGLDLAHEHRNYLPSLGILFALVFYGAQVLDRRTVQATTRVLLCTALVATLAFSTWVRANTWSNTVTLAHDTARQHPQSPRANNFAARTSLIEERDVVRAMPYALRGIELRPEEPGFHVDLHILLSVLATNLKQEVSGDRSMSSPTLVKVPGLNDHLVLSRRDHNVALSHPVSSSETVERLLGRSIVSVHTVISLDTLRACILTPPAPCAPLRLTALKWHDVASRNPRSAIFHRAVLARGAARLAAASNQPLLALEHIERAVALAPDHIAFRLARIDYLLQLNRTKEAIAAMEAVRGRDWPRADLATNKQLLEQLERRLEKQQTTRET